MYIIAYNLTQFHSHFRTMTFMKTYSLACYLRICVFQVHCSSNNMLLMKLKFPFTAHSQLKIRLMEIGKSDHFLRTSNSSDAC